MKKILSLFLSLTLVFSMTLSAFIPGAVFAAPGEKTLEKTNELYDTTGAEAGYAAPLSTTFHMTSKALGAQTATTHSSIEYRYCYMQCVGDEYRMVRMEQSGSAKDKYIQYSPNDDASRNDRDTNHYNGIYTYGGKYMCNKAKADGTIDYTSSTILLNRNKSDEIEFNVNTLKANTWYEYEYKVDASVTPYTFTVKYKNIAESESAGTPVYDFEGSGTFTSDTFTIRVDMDLTAESSFAAATYYETFKDYKLTQYFNVERTDILSVNNDTLVAPNQNTLTFTLSESIRGLKAEHIKAVDASGNENVATAISLSDEDKTVTATFTENFYAWSDYTLKIDSAVYDGYTYVSTGEEVQQSELEKPFSVASAGFDMREVSITSGASSVEYVMEYTNAESSCEPVTLILPVYSADGVMQSVTAASLSDLPVNGATKNANISSAFSAGQYAKMFAINGWSGKAPHFGRSWNVDAPVLELKAYSSAEPITIGEFDYENKKINVGIVTGTGTSTSGVLYVYDNTKTLSDSEHPIYTDYLTSYSDGTFAIDIPFKDNVDADTTTYKVEFASAVLGSTISDTFTVYDEEDIRIQKETAVYDAAKASVTVGGLRQVILGIDELENVINDNFEVFDYSADLTNYNKLKNKEQVFVKMLPSVASLANYEALVDLFEEKALEQYEAENTVTSSPSKDNSSYGGSSVSMKDNNPKPVTPVVPETSDNESSAPASSFKDMSGHWASKYAEELSKRGIMTGYPNGDFGGNNDISRAELAKTLVETMGVPAGSGSAFGDIDANAWHAPFVAGAANAGIITGFADGSFGPDISVTRQDAALMIYRALKLKAELPVGYTFFKDDLSIQDYASDAVRCLGELGIITGDPNGNFNPTQPITRGEIAALVCRALDYMESHQ